VKGADAISKNPMTRAGFVATNSISGGNNLPTQEYLLSKSVQTVWKRFAVSRGRLSLAGDGGFSRRL
jgi:hypothetical protein